MTPPPSRGRPKACRGRESVNMATSHAIWRQAGYAVFVFFLFRTKPKT
jgi:hypothetical protein